jgi:small subunit ribosomal protein S1
MNQPDSNDSDSHKPAAETAAVDPAAPAPPAAEPTAAPASAAETTESAGASDASDADDGDASDAGELDKTGEGEAAAGQATPAEGAPRRKRRRRRKKKPHAEGQAPGQPHEGGEAAGATGEGAATAEGGGPREGAPPRDRPPRPKRERHDRERPAFNVGDVVFGKVIEFTEDALFADLSGKAKAIFDLRELLITEDDVEEYTRADQREADELAAARAAGVDSTPDLGEAKDAHEAEAAHDAEAPVVGAEAAPAEQAAPAPETAQAEAVVEPAAPAVAPEVVAEPPPVVVAAEGVVAEAPAAEAPATGEATPDAAAAPESPEGEAAADEKQPHLPRVILEPGAPFVGLVHNDGGRGGLVVLTHHPKRVQKAKPRVSEASKAGTLIFGLVTGTIKGGVEVDVDGLRAFAPASHVELRPGADLSHLVGKRLPFAVTQYAKRGRDVVLSRRALLETEAKEKREEALGKLEIGAVVDGTVRTVVPFGAFVDVGGVEGLVPLSEMSHNRADQPKDVFKVGEPCKVKVLRVDEKGKLWLSRKAAIDDPWNQVAQKYAQGTKHKGTVARLQPFGAFIELEPGIDGLIHTADLSVKRIEHPEELVKVGQEIDIVVASVDARQHRIALHPAPTGEAANETPQRIQLHKTVKVVVVGVESGGLIVRVRGATGRNARGFVSAAATGTPRGTELRKLFPIGKELEVKIVELDPRRGELKLSIKALNEENERNAYQQYRAQVKREAKFGTLADLLAKRNITPSK